ncbi:MAG: radical SAM protein [Thermoplasmata archaeon]|nr:MAG: radical SAM protein [Thermoplasmata archaeon]
MTMEIYCKSALSKSKLPGIDYSLNPYFGCSYSCIYCYVPSLFNVERSEWRNVKVKKNMPDVLKKELRKKRKGIVGISSSTDAYQPLEKQYEITKKCLSMLSTYKWPIDILTKSDFFTRDLKIIKECNAKVGVTITTFNEEILQLWEPYAPNPENRLKAIQKFADEGIFTYIFFGPVFPLMKKDELNYCIEEFISAGVDEIIVDCLHLKRGVIESISKVFPNIIKYRKAHEDIFIEAKKIAEGKIAITKAW